MVYIGCEPNHRNALRVSVDGHVLVVALKAMVAGNLIPQSELYEASRRTRFIGLEPNHKKCRIFFEIK